jgi:hypothetical protein
MPWTREFFADIFHMLFFLSTWTEYFTFCFFFSDNEDPKKFAVTAPVTDAPVVDEPLHKRRLWCLSHQKLLPRRLVLVPPNA